MSKVINPYKIAWEWILLGLIYNFTLLVLGAVIVYLLHVHSPFSDRLLLAGAVLVAFAANIAFLLGPVCELLWCWLFTETENAIVRLIVFGLGYGVSVSGMLVLIAFLVNS